MQKVASRRERAFLPSEQLHELVEKEFRVRRTGGSLRVELGREPRIALVADALVGAIVHIDEKRFPIGAQGIIIHSIAMILAGDEATVGTHHTHGLVVAAVSILQFIYLGTSGLAEELIAHTDTKIGSFSLAIALRMFCTAASHVSGSPGPLEMKRPSKSKPLKS